MMYFDKSTIFYININGKVSECKINDLQLKLSSLYKIDNKCYFDKKSLTYISIQLPNQESPLEIISDELTGRNTNKSFAIYDDKIACFKQDKSKAIFSYNHVLGNFRINLHIDVSIALFSYSPYRVGKFSTTFSWYDRKYYSYKSLYTFKAQTKSTLVSWSFLGGKPRRTKEYVNKCTYDIINNKVIDNNHPQSKFDYFATQNGCQLSYEQWKRENTEKTFDIIKF